ncbi:MAG: N-acetylmuramoyl-L-alanine amidase family protein [Gammaproteobacteria bacterium]
MSKDLILREIYEINLKGKNVNEARSLRGNRLTQRVKTVQSSSGTKRRSFAVIFCSIALFSLLGAFFSGTANVWIFESAQTLGKNRTESVLFKDSSSLPKNFPPDTVRLKSNSFLFWNEDEETSIANLLGLGVKTIVIDPGHGGRDPGAIGPSGLMEKKVTMDLARRLKEKLERHRVYKIILTREDDSTMSLRDRVNFANERKADLFISLHINSIPVKTSTVIETYYFGPQSDENAKISAQRENQESEYSIGEFRKIVARIGDSLKQQESHKLAASIQQSLYNNLKKQEKSIKSWGIKTAPFVILLGAEMPSVLAEITTLSNEMEEDKLKTDAYREKIASYLEMGITSYLSQVNLNQNRLTGGKENDSKAGNG